MKRIDLNGQLHALPFAALLRPLTESEESDLVWSIRTHGVKTPLVTYLSDLHGRSVLDGANRARIAADLGLAELPVTSLGRLSDDLAEQLAVSLNADRRQLTAEERAAVAASRRWRVAEARAEGESLRAIAAAEGVSEQQVRRDLAAGATGGAPEPGKVRGRDGKQYPSQRREPTTEQHIAAMRRHVDRLGGGVDHLIDSDLSARFQAAAKSHGVPLSQDGEAWSWPVLASLQAVLAEVAAAQYAG